MLNTKGRQFNLHLMILPGLLLLFVYSYIPMAGITIAFKDFQPVHGLFGSKWIGLDNFKYVLAMPETNQVVWNTIFISFLKILFGLLAPIITALLLNEVLKNNIKRFVQTLIYLPHFLSWVILGGILIDILSPSQGVVNQILRLFHINPIFFMGNNNWFPIVLVVTDVWKEFGFGTIVFLAALTSINPALYEAATIDGANRWKQTWHITLPGMLPIIIMVSTLSLGNILNGGFDQVFNLYNPTVYESGDIIDTFVYRIGLIDAQYGVATAIGLFKSLVSFLLISTSYLLAYRFANYKIF